MYNEDMSANTLNYKTNSSAFRRIGAIASLLAIFSLVAFIISYMVSSAVGYVNQPPFQTYTSTIGAISITYPTGMVLEHRNYGGHIDSATLRSSYNTIDNFDNDKGEGILLFVKAEKVTPDYKTMEEEIESEVDIFKKVYFYEDPEQPNRLKEAQRYATITRKEHTKTISGHDAMIFDITEQDDYSSTEISGYTRHTLILIPSGDILYQIEGQTRERTEVFDGILDSITIGAKNE